MISSNMRSSNVPHTVYLTDGSFDFSNGVDSSKVTTVASEMNPSGLERNYLSWLVNGTVRGGGILQRGGWPKNGDLHDGSSFYQGGYMYEPRDGSNPYLIASIGGHIYKYVFDSGVVTDLSVQFGLFNPPNVEQAFFCQGEEFLVIQAGDGVTLPLFWDGTTLVRSRGITPASVTLGILTILNVNDSANVGATIPETIGVGVFAGGVQVLSISQLGSFVMPAVGGTVNTTFYSIASNAYPTSNFSVSLAGGIGMTGSLRVTTVVTQTSTTNGFFELPAATCMDYYLGRLWYAQGRYYGAGDIVQGSSGTAAYDRRDSILKVTENPLCIGGDNFAVPANAGNIRALKHTANINSDLGVSELYIATRKAVFSLNVPVTRSAWIAADQNNMPLQKIVQLNNGWVNDRSVVPVNGDLFGQSLEPSVRSIKTAIRNFNEWGNIPISNNVERALKRCDRELMRFSSGIEFENRLYQAILQRRLPQGVVSDGVIVLDFDITNTLQDQSPPAWDGILSGQQILQIFSGDFSGRDRAFMVVVSQLDSTIDVWEITNDLKFDNEDSRVVWSSEFPAYTWGKEYELKRLVGGELWLSRVFGQVNVRVDYRVDSDPCWRFWHYQELCVARNCEEDELAPGCVVSPYPGPSPYQEGYKWSLVFPKPKAACDSMGVRPTDIGYQFQVKVTIQGWCQIRGIILYATPEDKSIYQGLNCA